MFVGTLPDRASPSTSPRWAPLDHVNGVAVLATRGERNAFADSLPIPRLGSPGIAPFGGWLGPLRAFANRLFVSIARPGFPVERRPNPAG